ncbi:MAG: stage sporulation protein SpoIID [Bacilli bacterium]|nr:stage sporulation protein SpoIID [Bacilli bacterium]
MIAHAKFSKRIVLLVAIFLVISSHLFQTNTLAAVPKLDNIRVALFIDTGNYHLNSPTATLTSDSGMTIGMRTPAGVQNWQIGDSSKTIRGTIDQFMVQVLETTDANKASILKQSLNDSSYNGYVFNKTKQGKALFQVWAGPYETKDAAAAAKDAISKNAKLAALINIPNNTTKLTGPLHWNAGSYASVSEAVYAQTNLAQTGIVADLAYQANAAGTTTYSVWVGNESDQAALDLVKQQSLKILPSLVLQAVDANAAYLLKRDDSSAAVTGQAVIPHYFFNSVNQKVWITGVNQAKITVKEKANHSYRGSMEWSQFTNKMALINEVPFEQYLYGVVGSEMETGWPLEALKAQAVAARTYALQRGMAYKIANISDSTTDQVYNGTEYADIIKAVDATKGEVLVDKNGLITPFYSANAGGVSADPSEVWGSSDAYLKSFPSPGDDSAQSKAIWRHVVLLDGTVGYVLSDYLKDTGLKNSAGLPIYESTDQAVNVRQIASSRDTISLSIAKINKGDHVVAIGQSLQSGSYNWQRGPVDAAALAAQMNSVLVSKLSAPLQSLKVTSRGPSGRVIGLQANGQEVKVTHPDSYRTVLGSLPSTLFEIEETGSYTVLGANGAVSTFPQTTSGGLYVLQGQQLKSQVTQKQWFTMNADQQVRPVTTQPQFIFTGKGYGHGLGMSQDGANGFAQQGYDYQKILKSYYAGVNIVKE